MPALCLICVAKQRSFIQYMSIFSTLQTAIYSLYSACTYLIVKVQFNQGKSETKYLSPGLMHKRLCFGQFKKKKTEWHAKLLYQLLFRVRWFFFHIKRSVIYRPVINQSLGATHWKLDTLMYQVVWLWKIPHTKYEEFVESGAHAFHSCSPLTAFLNSHIYSLGDICIFNKYG